MAAVMILVVGTLVCTVMPLITYRWRRNHESVEKEKEL